MFELFLFRGSELCFFEYVVGAVFVGLVGEEEVFGEFVEEVETYEEDTEEQEEH